MHIGSFGVITRGHWDSIGIRGWPERISISGSNMGQPFLFNRWKGIAVDLHASCFYHTDERGQLWFKRDLVSGTTLGSLPIPTNGSFMPREVDFWSHIWGVKYHGSRFCKVDWNLSTFFEYEIATLNRYITSIKISPNSATLILTAGSQVFFSPIDDPTNVFKIFDVPGVKLYAIHPDYTGNLITIESNYLRRRSGSNGVLIWSKTSTFSQCGKEIAVSTCGTIYVPSGKRTTSFPQPGAWRFNLLGSCTGTALWSNTWRQTDSAALDRYNNLYIGEKGGYTGGKLQKYDTKLWPEGANATRIWGISSGQYGREVLGDWSGYRNLHLATEGGTETFFQVGSYEMSINWDMFGPEASSASCLYETAINGTGATEVVQLKGTYPLYSEFGSFVSGVIDLGENWIATSFSWGATEISNSTVGSIIDGTRKFFYRTSEYPPMWNSNGSPWKNYDFPIGNDSVFGSSAPWYPIASGESIPANKSRRYIQFMFPLWS